MTPPATLGIPIDCDRDEANALQSTFLLAGLELRDWESLTESYLRLPVRATSNMGKPVLFYTVVAYAETAYGRDRLPVLLKAVAGGGGKGMRVVREEGELEGAIAAARREAEAAFGDGRLCLGSGGIRRGDAVTLAGELAGRDVDDGALDA